MTTLFRILTLGDALLLTAVWVTGLLRPVSLGTPDEFHMPLGLLACVVTLLVQAYFLSYLITTGWDVRHFAEDQGLDPETASKTRTIKGRCLPWIALPALGAVACGILGMGVRAMVFPAVAHRIVTALTWLAACGAAWVQPRAVAELEELMAGLGLTDEVRLGLGNR